jgi:hypothetical protein
MDHTREERLKARRVEDGVPEEEGEDVWGGSDEEVCFVAFSSSDCAPFLMRS